VDGSGRLTGVFKTTRGTTINVSGQATGQAINFVFDLANNQFIFAIGTLQQDIRACTPTGGGLFTGPKEGDEGDWGMDHQCCGGV
jgi:hypothetical protein